MSGKETEQLFSMIQASADTNREAILEYVKKNKDQLVEDLNKSGFIEIPVAGGVIVLRKTSQAA